MLNIKKLGVSLATSALMLGALAPATFAADLTISGNGADSNNRIYVHNHCRTSLSQSNHTLVVTAVSSSASTGGNSASRNTTTGGDVSIDTGAASSTVLASVEGGSNSASDLPSCCDCVGGSESASITGNGVDSYNKVKVSNSSSSSVRQSNKTAVITLIKSKASTGRNRANRNTTTDGDVSVTTDDATSTVGVSVTAPSNTLNP